MTNLALDRKSGRRIDADGHMHVEMSNISAARVNPYRGSEIPGYKALGLDPDRIYQLYRDPVELEAAAKSFAGKPLLLHHKPVTSDDHPSELVVGAVGTDVRFAYPYLKAPLSVWRKDAIDLIESKEQAELSCGYRYTPIMNAGFANGVRFDGRMRQLRGNHVTIVRAGRAGSDCVVADAAPVAFDPKILGLSHIKRG